MTFTRRAHVLCLAMAAGEERQAQRTLEEALAHAVEPAELVLLRLGKINLPPPRRPPGPRRSIRVIDVAADGRGALYQALMSLPGSYPFQDLLFFRPGVRLPRAWDARLRCAAYAATHIGCAAPLSDRWADLSPAPSAGVSPENATVEETDRWVYALGQHRNVEVSTLEADCIYVRREAIEATAAAVTRFRGSAAQFPAYLGQQVYFHGYANVVADHLWAGTPPGRGRGHDAPLKIAGTPAAPRRAAIAALEEAVRQARQQQPAPPPIPAVDDLPRQLHVMHNWGGGLGRWVHDYCRADHLHSNLALKPIGRIGCLGEALGLYAHVDDPQPIQTWKFDPPIDTTAVTHVQYQEILEQVIETYGVASIMISCLAGQSLDVLRTEIPTLVVCHDYYPFCAAFHICFEGVCRECGPARLAECFARNEHNTLVRQAGAAHWAAVRENFVQTMTARRIPMAAPSQAVVENLTRLEPRLAGPHFQVIPHGIDTAAFPPLWAVKHERLRGVVLGRLTPEKGGDLLWEALSGLGQCCDVALLGCQDAGQRFAGMPHVTMLPQYDLRELPALLARHQPDFGMVLSVCPETFCYTLSEMMCLGIPPVATRLGGPAERIQHGVNGFLCEPTAADLLRTVRGLVEEPERLARVRRNLARVRHRTLEEMVAEYHAILSVPTFCEARYLRGNGEVRGAAAPLLLPAAALPPTAGELIEQAAREETFAQLVKRVYAIAEWKVARTPQLSRWQRRIAGMVLHGGWQMLKIGKRISRIGPRRKAA